MRKPKALVAGLVLVASLMVVTVAEAIPITFIHSAVGSGSIGGISFSNTTFTIEAHGDTTSRFDWNDLVTIVPHTTASVALDGIGAFAISESTATFVNRGNCVALPGEGCVGVLLNSDPGTDLLDGPSSMEFLAWDIASAVGPITGPGSIFGEPYFGYLVISTSGGELVFSGISYGEPLAQNTTVTFQAAVGQPVPEPASLLLLLSGLAALKALRRQRCSSGLTSRH